MRAQPETINGLTEPRDLRLKAVDLAPQALVLKFIHASSEPDVLNLGLCLEDGLEIGIR
jgi:hypothetical protein